MPKSHEAGTPKRSVVVINHDLGMDPIQRYSNDELKKIMSCGNCFIHAPGAQGGYAAGGIRGSGGAAPARSKAARPRERQLSERERKETSPGERPAEQEGTGAFVPFASGGPVSMRASAGGGTYSVIGFGNSADGFESEGGVIDLSTAANMAFLLPEGGRVASFAAQFHTSKALELGRNTVSVTARLFQSVLPGSLFTPVPSTSITLSPALSDSVEAGTVCSGGFRNLSIPLAEGARLMAVFSAEIISGAGDGVFVSGFASAGLTIR